MNVIVAAKPPSGMSRIDRLREKWIRSIRVDFKSLEAADPFFVAWSRVYAGSKDPSNSIRINNILVVIVPFKLYVRKIRIPVDMQAMFIPVSYAEFTGDKQYEGKAEVSAMAVNYRGKPTLQFFNVRGDLRSFIRRRRSDFYHELTHLYTRYTFPFRSQLLNLLKTSRSYAPDLVYYYNDPEEFVAFVNMGIHDFIQSQFEKDGGTTIAKQTDERLYEMMLNELDQNFIKHLDDASIIILNNELVDLIPKVRDLANRNLVLLEKEG